MFQALQQGATVSVLYRNEPRVADAKVISVNTHIPTYNPTQPMAMFNGLVTDITLQVGNDTIPFVGLPANGTVANFPDKGLFLAIDKEMVLKEVNLAITALQQDIDALPAKEKLLSGYKDVRLELSPDIKREAKQEQDMSDLRAQVAELKELLSAALGSKNN